MKFFRTSCKKATLLVSKKEEGRLTWLESTTLKSHLSICSLCRKFESQITYISRMVRKKTSQTKLSPEAKEKMQQHLEESVKGKN